MTTLQKTLCRPNLIPSLLSDARSLLERGHALALEHLGEDNFDTLKTASNLAGCLVAEVLDHYITFKL